MKTPYSHPKCYISRFCKDLHTSHTWVWEEWQINATRVEIILDLYIKSVGWAPSCACSIASKGMHLEISEQGWVGGDYSCLLPEIWNFLYGGSTKNFIMSVHSFCFVFLFVFLTNCFLHFILTMSFIYYRWKTLLNVIMDIMDSCCVFLLV